MQISKPEAIKNYLQVSSAIIFILPDILILTEDVTIWMFTQDMYTVKANIYLEFCIKCKGSVQINKKH